jgi:hypothetical protein
VNNLSSRYLPDVLTLRVVERINAWLESFRRIRFRYDYTIVSFRAFVLLAYLVIGVRRLIMYGEDTVDVIQLERVLKRILFLFVFHLHAKSMTRKTLIYPSRKG